jgi:hypothetical protein
MFEGIKDLLNKVETKSDLATVLIFGTSGFLLDAGLNVVGFLEPGLVGVAAASGALGIKKAAESALAKRSEQKEKEKRLDEETKRATELRALLGDDTTHQDLAQRLELELKLSESNIIDADALKTSVEDIIKEYRRR